MPGWRAEFSILIVTHNTIAEVLPLLGDIRRLEPAAPVLVVDNASRDGTPEQIGRHFPDVAVLANKENVGYARAVNQGLRACLTEFAFLLNPDIRLPEPGFFARLLETGRSSPRVAAVGPLQVQQRRGGPRLTLTWSYWSAAGLRLYFGGRSGWGRGGTVPLRVPFLNAGCLLLRSTALHQIGLLSERYFLYGEEPDLCLKLRLHGYECWLDPRTWVAHQRESSFSQLPGLVRLRLKLTGLRNIGDALLRGWTRLLWSSVSQSRPASEAQRAILDWRWGRRKGSWNSRQVPPTNDRRTTSGV